MLNIKMEPNTRNYLVRLLENYKNSLRYTNMLNTEKEMELNKIRIATARLMGQAPDICLNKNEEVTNYVIGDKE